MLNPYTYHFIFTVHLKNGKEILLENTRQQLYLWTEEEAKDHCEEKDFTDPSCCGTHFTHVGKKYVKFYDDMRLPCLKVNKKDFDHIHMSRKAESKEVSLKTLISECDSERVLQYIRERLGNVENLELKLFS